MAMIQSGGAHSNIAQRLSTAIRTSADKAWIGAPSPDGLEVAVAADCADRGGSTSIGTDLTGSSPILGGVSIGGKIRRLML